MELRRYSHVATIGKVDHYCVFWIKKYHVTFNIAFWNFLSEWNWNRVLERYSHVATLGKISQNQHTLWNWEAIFLSQTLRNWWSSLLVPKGRVRRALIYRMKTNASFQCSHPSERNWNIFYMAARICSTASYWWSALFRRWIQIFANSSRLVSTILPHWHHQRTS